MTDDGQLLHHYVKEQSEAAFAELVRRHVGFVYHSALRQLGGDAHGAEDVAQDVFIHLARHAGEVRHHPALAGWLYQTTHFKAREAIRARRRRQIREQKAHAMHQQETAPEPLFDWGPLRPVLDEAVMDLGATDREAVVLRYFQGRSFSDIGAALGLTEGTAQKRVDRALDKLRGLLARRQSASSSAALVMALSSQAGLAAPAGLESSITGAALASIAAVGPSTLHLLQLVSSAKAALSTGSVLAFSTLLGFSSLGLAVYQAQGAHALHSSLAGTTRAYEAEQAQLRLLDQNAQAARQRSLALERQIGLATSVHATRRDPGAMDAARQAALDQAKADGQAFIRAYPQYREALNVVENTQIEEACGAFFRGARLSPAQIRQFVELTEQVHARSLAVTSEGSIRPTVNYPSADELRPVLGDDGVRQFEDYRRSLKAREVWLALRIEGGLGQDATVGRAGRPADRKPRPRQLLLSERPRFHGGDAGLAGRNRPGPKRRLPFALAEGPERSPQPPGQPDAESIGCLPAFSGRRGPSSCYCWRSFPPDCWP